MEIPEIKIPEIRVETVYVPYVPTPIDTPAVIPGCQYTHRDINLNPSLLIDDPNGVFPTCPEGEIPHFYPMDYTPKNITVIEEAPPVDQQEPNIPETEEQGIPEIPKKKKEEQIVECPGPNDQRVGDFRNDKKLERVSGHRLSLDGTRCITEYESTSFVQQFIPPASAISSTVVIGLVAASSPLLLNVIKPLVKQVVKKITGKKKENEREE
jgi:hypothetical protein